MCLTFICPLTAPVYHPNFIDWNHWILKLNRVTCRSFYELLFCIFCIDWTYRIFGNCKFFIHINTIAVHTCNVLRYILENVHTHTRCITLCLKYNNSRVLWCSYNRHKILHNIARHVITVLSATHHPALCKYRLPSAGFSLSQFLLCCSRHNKTLLMFFSM